MFEEDSIYSPSSWSLFELEEVQESSFVIPKEVTEFLVTYLHPECSELWKLEINLRDSVRG